MNRQQSLSLDVSGISSQEQLYTLILNQFKFPKLYERSWNGLDEHLFYDSMMRVPERLEVIGLSALEARNSKIALRFKKWVLSAKSMDVAFRD
jgi:hypothetical protein